MSCWRGCYGVHFKQCCLCFRGNRRRPWRTPTTCLGWRTRRLDSARELAARSLPVLLFTVSALMGGCQLLRFIFHLILRSYDYNMHIEGFLPASLSLVSWNNVCNLKDSRNTFQMLNEPSSFKTKLIANNAEVSRVNRNILCCLTSPRSRRQTSRCKVLLCPFWTEELAPCL